MIVVMKVMMTFHQVQCSPVTSFSSVVTYLLKDEEDNELCE